MATTTADAIRDRAITVIGELVADSLAETRFLPSRNENEGNFDRWANGNPAAALRRFQVRTRGTDRVPEVSNHDLEEHVVELIVRVAYPKTHRFGDDNALDRDDVIDQDRHAIENAIGLRGAHNFTTPWPDATWLDIPYEPARETGTACDILVIRQRMAFMLDTAAPVDIFYQSINVWLESEGVTGSDPDVLGMPFNFIYPAES